MRPRLLDLFCGAGGAAMGVGSDTERAWAAGFFDGEGCVAVRRDKRPGRTLGLQLSLEQVDHRPILRFFDAVGQKGRITVRPPRAPNRKPLHRIHMGDAAARQTIATLWPWLSEPKREQFISALREIGEIP